MNLKSNLDVVWGIYWLDVSLLTLSFCVTLLLRLEGMIFEYHFLFLFRHILGFFFVSMSTTFWCQTYRDLWGTAFRIEPIALLSFLSYGLFLPLMILMNKGDESIPLGSLGIGFFLAILFLFLPRILMLSKHKSKGEPIIVVGRLKTLKKDFLCVEEAGYSIQAAIAIDYHGPTRMLGHIPVIMFENCPKGKTLAILEENIDDKNLAILQYLVEHYGMKFVSFQKNFYVEELGFSTTF